MIMILQKTAKSFNQSETRLCGASGGCSATDEDIKLIIERVVK